MANQQRQYNAVVTPAVVAAMQRDPRVALANQALAAGSSTAPVQGWGDGLARVLQGAMGGLANSAAQKKYVGEQKAYMDDVNAQIAKVLGGTPGQTPPIAPAPGGATPAAGGAPSVLPPPVAATPPAGGPSGPAPAPTLPSAPPASPSGPGAPPMAGPAAGAPPMAPPGGPPIASTGDMNPGMPNMPSVPNSPESIRKRLGLALMAGGNPYSFNQGLPDFYAGLQEDAQNEAVRAQRQYDLERGTYEAGLGNYYNAQQQRRGAEYDRIGDERRFAQDEKTLRMQFDNQWKLQQSAQGFQASEAEKDRSWQRYQFQYQQSGMDPNTFGMQPDNVFAALVQQESGGRAGVLGPQTKYGRAVGATQLLPATAKQMADKLGIPFRPDLLQGKSQEAMAYQLRLGRAYFDEGLDKYNGDIGKALAYYHGGPDESLWGPKTRKYVSDVLGRIGGGVSTGFAGNTTGGTGPGGGRTPFGIRGGSGAGRKPLPSRMEGVIAGLGSQLDKTIGLAEAFNDDYFGYGVGAAGRAANLFTEATGIGDQGRVDWWKQYDAMNNIVRNQLFGSALTANEQRLWEQSVISPGTSPAVARRYLDTQVGLLRKATERQAGSASQVYNGNQIYELLGGEDMASRVYGYKPLAPTQTATRSGGGNGRQRNPPRGTRIAPGIVADGKGGYLREVADAAPTRQSPQQRQMPFGFGTGPTMQPQFRPGISRLPQQQPDMSPGWFGRQAFQRQGG